MAHHRVVSQCTFRPARDQLGYRATTARRPVFGKTVTAVGKDNPGLPIAQGGPAQILSPASPVHALWARGSFEAVPPFV